mmetsp:Transcript_45463/g.84466  ORF Transcript_45463/g.84466 Transcript_45463/m.84466 type:complete len:371 (-) Transcript_45463:739-1851(-)
MSVSLLLLAGKSAHVIKFGIRVLGRLSTPDPSCERRKRVCGRLGSALHGDGALSRAAAGHKRDLALLRLPPHLHPRAHGLPEPLKVHVQVPQLSVHAPAQLHVRIPRVVLAAFRQLHRVEEADHGLLPLEPLVLFEEVGERVAGLVVLDVRVARLRPHAQVVRHRFGRPPSPHVVVPAPRLPHPHEPLHKRGADELSVKRHVHGTERVQHSFRHRESRVHVTLVLLLVLEQLRGGVVVVVVQPQPVAHRGGHSRPQAVREPPHKVRPRAVRVIHRVEKVRRARAQQVARVLLHSVHELSVGAHGRPAVVIHRVHQLLATHQEPKVADARVFLGDDPRLVSQRSLHVPPVVQLVIRPRWDLEVLVRVPVLH